MIIHDPDQKSWPGPLKSSLHTLCLHYVHAAANQKSGYIKYVKVVPMHYFYTITLRKPCAVLK